MPRPGPRRPQVVFRIAEDDLATIDRLAEAERVERSEMIRRLLAEAVTARTATDDAEP